jgi:tRNA-specific 2-thiouridylase
MTIDASFLDGMRQSLGLEGVPAETRVVVAMSGGVDSSVVAGLLKLAGYDVVGITLQLYDHGSAVGHKRACCAGQDIYDARRVASALGIPHYVLDFESRFRSAVIEEFADAYVAGETPVPCVRCNQTVKFADLFERAKGLGAAALATGHYVRSVGRPGTRHRDLLTATDLTRDQSYFLFATTQEQLDFLRFPLGCLRKAETREAATAMRLPVADKPDSQDICFVPNGRYADVIAKLRPGAGEPGDIVDLEGRVLGRHGGVLNFTIGQRRGLGLAAGEPLYVVRLDAARRQVVVGPKSALLRSFIRLRDVNWLGEDAVLEGAGGLRIWAKIRSTRPAVPASVRFDGAGAAVSLDEAEPGVAPGQACVFYDRPGTGARVLGGGFIAAASFAETAVWGADCAAASRGAPPAKELCA